MSIRIALLRGINVSGQKSIKMADLTRMMEELGFENVKTYIQSGNMVFSDREKTAEKAVIKIQKAIQKSFGFPVEVFVKSTDDFENVLANNPFEIRKDYDPKRLYVTFLSSPPAKENWQAIERARYLPEEALLHNDVLYFYSPLGYGNAKMNNNFFEQKLKLKGTTRNWNTVQKLFEMGSNQTE